MFAFLSIPGVSGANLPIGLIGFLRFWRRDFWLPFLVAKALFGWTAGGPHHRPCRSTQRRGRKCGTGPAACALTNLAGDRYKGALRGDGPPGSVAQESSYAERPGESKVGP